MANQDHIVRAQARALLRVVEHYRPRSDVDFPLAIWRELEAFAERGTSADLQTMGRRHAGTAAAAFCGGIKNQAPKAALLLALTSFTKSSPPYRLHDPSRWIALMLAFIGKRSKADPDVQEQVLERLIAAFEVERHDLT